MRAKLESICPRGVTPHCDLLASHQLDCWVLQTLDALAYLHVHRVVHRDIWSPNVFLDASGVARLADLGNATIYDADTIGSGGRHVTTEDLLAAQSMFRGWAK